jgi:hypothetical protein
VLREEIVAIGGGVVLIDDGGWVDGQRSCVEDATA